MIISYKYNVIKSNYITRGSRHNPLFHRVDDTGSVGLVEDDC
jgi:hypothetical protein